MCNYATRYGINRENAMKIQIRDTTSGWTDDKFRLGGRQEETNQKDSQMRISSPKPFGVVIIVKEKDLYMGRTVKSKESGTDQDFLT